MPILRTSRVWTRQPPYPVALDKNTYTDLFSSVFCGKTIYAKTHQASINDNSSFAESYLGTGINGNAGGVTFSVGNVEFLSVILVLSLSSGINCAIYGRETPALSVGCSRTNVFNTYVSNYSSNAIATSISAFGCSWTSGGFSFYQNGILTRSVGAGLPAITDAIIKASFSSNAGLLHFFAFSTMPVPAFVMRDLTRNPWQIFKPASRVLYFPVSGTVSRRHHPLFLLP